MKPLHIFLGVLVAAIWGFNFVPIKIVLETFPPLLLNAVRFSVVALLVFFLPRPKLSWKQLASVAAFLFLFQFSFLFLSMKLGMLPGLASVIMQVQAFITLALAVIFLREKPTKRQLGGSLLAMIGLGLIAFTIGADVPMIAFLLTLIAATCWSCGNILLRKTQYKGNMLALVAWMSLLLPIPAFTASLVFEGWPAISYAFTHITPRAVVCVIFIAGLSTLVGYGIWGYLLQHYTAARVAVFAFMVPVFGILSSHLVFGEEFGTLRLAGMGLILAGLSITLAPKLSRRKQVPDLPD
jgi:O-acetylserine/cysteine efflux transporter